MYNSSTKQITSPVTISDISKAIGSSSNSLGYMIANGDINIWSKCKPFRSMNIAFADDDARNLARYNADCGLYIRSYTSLYTLLSAVKLNAVGTLNWTYNRPNGSTYHYRMGDFIGYQGKDTYPPDEYGLTATSKYYEDVLGVQNTDHIHTESLRLKLSDMKTTQELLTAAGRSTPYIGFVYCNKNSFSQGNCRAVTLDNLESNDNLLLSSTLTAGVSYVGAFFYSSVSINNVAGANLPSGKFIPIAYPRADFSVDSGFGLQWSCRCSHMTSYVFNVTPKVYGGNAYGERTIDILSFHQRSSGHYSTNGGGLYTITDSADSSGYEQDAVIFGSSANALGTNVKYISNDGYASTSNASGRDVLDIMFTFNVDVTRSGSMTFVKYRHLTLVGTRWHQVTVVTPLSYIIQADNESGL